MINTFQYAVMAVLSYEEIPKISQRIPKTRKE